MDSQMFKYWYRTRLLKMNDIDLAFKEVKKNKQQF